MGNYESENGAPAPEGEAPETPAPEAPPAPEWQGPTREEWEAAQQFQQQAIPILNQVHANMQMLQPNQPQQPQRPPEIDPFEPRTVQEYIDYQLSQRTANYDNMVQLVEAEQGEKLARTELERLSTTYGEFDHETALIMASSLLDRGLPPAQALEQAASLLHDREEQIRASERERHGIQLQAVHEAPREGPGNSVRATEAERVATGRDRYEETVERFLASRRAGLPIG